jgi:diguanylate cyclase (GGDEF)-like protein
VHVTDAVSSLRSLLSELGEECDLPAGTLLWREGDRGDEVVLVKSGKLEVVHEGPEGDVVVLRELEEGSVLGEIACLDGYPRSASVRASTHTRISRVPAPQFRELLHERPEILEALLLQQVQIVRSLTGQVTRNHRRAITDPLTRLYNLGFFSERLSMELERARETDDPVSVVMFDIDHFKHYNDTHGHQQGNVALAHVGEILKTTGRRGDIVARYGGEEFVALLYGASRDEARRFAESVRLAIESAEFPGAEHQPLGRITISGGVASFPADAPTRDSLVEHADRNLYTAKQAGRNRVVADPA